MRNGSTRGLTIRRCALPLTAARVAQTIISELAVIDVTPGELVVREIAEDTTVDALRARTDAELDVDQIRGTF